LPAQSGGQTVRAELRLFGYQHGMAMPDILRKRRIMTLELLRARREQILATARRHGARTLRVFGSVARGDAGVESDVDFLVELEPGRSLLDQGALLMDLQEQLGCRVDVMTEAGLRPSMRARVLQEVIAL
jgi:uncharacterized protein